jgi:hypothetical protein
MQDVGYAQSTPRGVTLPKDVARWEANRVYNEQLLERCLGGRESEGDESPSEPESSGGASDEEDEDEEEGQVTPPFHSPPPKDIPSLSDLFNQQVGISVGVRGPKRPRTGTGASSSPLP